MVSKKLRIETIDFRVFMRLLIGVSNAEEYKYLFSFYGEQDQRFGIKSFKMKIPHKCYVTSDLGCIRFFDTNLDKVFLYFYILVSKYLQSSLSILYKNCAIDSTDPK